MQTAKKPFNVNLSPEQRQMVAHMAQQEGTSIGHIIRKAIEARYQMQVLGVPVCANSTRCLVPQMHAAPMQQARPMPPPVFP